MKEALIVFPPQWCPFNPYPSVPVLSGCLKAAGFASRGLDLNIRFYNALLTKERLSRAIRTVYAEPQPSLPDRAHAEQICDGIEQTLDVFRNEALFYQPDLLFRAKADLYAALEILSAEYAPSRLMISDYFHRIDLSDMDRLEAECADAQHNIFYDFLEGQAREIAADACGYILISVTDITQILAAFTLCAHLKRLCDKPVCVGGNIVTKLKKAFLSEERILGRFADYAACGMGERAVVSFAEAMNGMVPLRDVPGLVYRDGGRIVANPESTAPVLQPVFPDYTGLDFSDYLSPAPDCSLQLSYGCYWGKCAFCDVSFNRERYIAKPIDLAIREIAHLVSLGIHHIHLGDSSVSPAYFDKLCDAILDRGLEVYLFAFARLERAFTPELLGKMYRAGVRLIFWGYESESERIMALINKGIDNSGRNAVLKDSAAAGIWNHVSYMMGFPGETRAETEATLQTIRDSREFADSCFLARFSFKANAKIGEDADSYGLTDVRRKGSLSTECVYQSDGMTKEEIRAVSKAFRGEYIRSNADTLWPMVCDDLEHLLFYLSRYGREGVRRMRLRDTATAEDLYKKYFL